MSYRAPGQVRWMRGFNGAFDKGVATAKLIASTEADNPYRMYEHKQNWLTGFQLERKKLGEGL